jgi:hypothetical protein
MTYAFANPSAADLVDTVDDWPGFTTFQATLSAGHIIATRPKHFFHDDGSSPEVVRLRIARPHRFDHLEQDDWAGLLAERVWAKEAEHRQLPCDYPDGEGFGKIILCEGMTRQEGFGDMESTSARD